VSRRALTAAEVATLPYRLGVGVMLLDRGGRVFAGQRLDSPGPAWQMPQGGIDEGEDPRVAALRELEEETGLPASAVEIIAETPDWISYDLPVELVPRVWKGRYRGQKQRWFLMRLTGDEALVDIARSHPEFSAWRWMPPDELVAAIVPFKRELYARVLAAFAADLGRG
jgi:putative (di)nucleoside polyphosphate hydrolase